MKSLFIASCFLLLLFGDANAQLVEILDENAPGWAYLHPTNGIDPTTNEGDPDFQATWFHQDFGTYLGGSYDGPTFTAGVAPFAYGGVDGIPAFPPLEKPLSGDRYTSYFVKVIEGGANGYHSLEVDLLADDGAFVYLNGILIGRDNFGVADLDTYTKVVGPVGNEFNYDHLALIGTPTLNSGPNLLAISVHNTSTSSSDLGFGIRVRGIDAATPIPVTLAATTDSTWGYLNSLDGSNNGIDPGASDADFDATWFDQSFGTYVGAASYDGPLFTTGATGPFEYGTVDGIPSAGTTLTTPVNGTRRTAYFLYEIDGGATGYSDLDLVLLADDGAIVYLNGDRIAKRNFLPSAIDTWSTLTGSSGFESDFSSIPFAGTTTPLVKPGPNLLAVSVHQTAINSSDLGLRLRITGQPGLPDIAAVYANQITPTSADLSWYTGQDGDSTVSYGLAPGSLGMTSNVPGSRSDHSLSLSGLSANTTYYFEVSSTDGGAFSASETGSFTTLIDPAVVNIVRGPYLQSVGDDRITVRWSTSLSGDSTVRYGATQGSLSMTESIPGSSVDHRVPLTGLTAGTTYFYQVESNNGNGGPGDSVSSAADADHFFTTAPATGTAADTRIWVIGDSGTANERARRVFEAFSSYNGQAHADVWLMLGDNAYDSGTDDEYQAAVFDTYPDIIRNTPIWPTFGNHDRRSQNGAPYYSIFELPTAGECGGVASGNESYYSFDHGNIHFVCLDSETSANYNDTLGGTPGMADWLQSDLEATTADWIIAFFHHGPYTKGSHDSDFESHHIAIRGNILPILEAYGVDLILSGHSHCYERSELLHGHYGSSGTFDTATHSVDSGNGSTVGSIDTAGEFVADGGDGAYQKALGAANIGQVSSIVGSSGKVSAWDNNSTELVNPQPHPVHLANLRLLGSMVIDISHTSNTLHAVFLDDDGAVRDDFTIAKSAAPVLNLAATDASMTEDPVADNTATFTVSRSGPTTDALAVDYTVSGSASSDDYTPALVSGTLDFAIGESSKDVVVTIVSDSEAEGSEILILSLMPRSSAPATFLGPSHDASASLSDLASQNWWFGTFSSAVLSPALWALDHDADSLVALYEYGLGGDPLLSDFASVGPTLGSTATDLELRYTRDNSKTDIQYQVYTSVDLVNWTDEGVVDLVDGTPNPTGIEDRIVSMPLDPRRFLTLRVTLP